ncbi:MAG: histidine kinase, partial [Flavitalea sp.]
MAISPFTPSRNRWKFACCWLLWVGIHYTMLLHFGISDGIAIADAAISNGLLAMSLFLFSNTLGFYNPSNKKYVFLFAWCLAVAGLWSLAVKYGLAALFSYDHQYLAFLAQSIPVRFNIALMATGCTAITSALWYYQEEQKALESRKLSAEKLEKDAELFKLRQQLQPHFLFNSLNSISALTGSDPEQARKMIQHLSDFLRGALKKEDHQW